MTKINHLNFGDFLNSVGDYSIITPHVIASNHILRYIRAKENSRGGSMETLIKFKDIEIMEFKINEVINLIFILHQYLIIINYYLKITLLVS